MTGCSENCSSCSPISGRAVRPTPQGRVYNPALGGGALLDLGIYPVWFSHLWLGKPKTITAIGNLTSTGVDARTAIVLGYESGAQAVLSTNLMAFSPARASVSGSAGRIEVNPWFAVPAGFELVAPGKGDVRIQFVNDTGNRVSGRARVGGRGRRAACRRWTDGLAAPSVRFRDRGHGDHGRSPPSGRNARGA